MTDLPRLLVAKYTPDVFRNEPRNIGVVLWTPDEVAARFLGEKPDAPGEVDEAAVPAFVASVAAYKQWVRYWRREVAKLSTTSPDQLDSIRQTGPSNYSLADGGVLLEFGHISNTQQVVDRLFADYTTAPTHSSPGASYSEALRDARQDRRRERILKNPTTSKGVIDLPQVWKDYRACPTVDRRTRLLEHYLPLVKYNAERIWQRLPDGVDLDDLISAGTFGLMDAVDTFFDRDRGVNFEKYCTPRIRGSILDELRCIDWVPRVHADRSAIEKDIVEGGGGENTSESPARQPEQPA